MRGIYQRLPHVHKGGKRAAVAWYPTVGHTQHEATGRDSVSAHRD